MLTEHEIDAYLRRIAYEGPSTPTLETLMAIHRAHMYAVPFENLHITLGWPLSLDLPRLFEKVVVKGHGGFCYELNYLLYGLLSALGYEVSMLGAEVLRDGRRPIARAHMCLLISLQGRHWLADVGFGDSFREPLPLEEGVWAQVEADYRLREEQGAWVLLQRCEGEDWKPQCRFRLEDREIGDFNDMFHYQQTSPESTFTRRSICSLATPGGRKTLSDGHYIETREGRKREVRIADPREYRRMLAEQFGITLPEDVDLGSLVQRERA